MVSVYEKEIKGQLYIYLQKSIRIENRVATLSRYIGKHGELSKVQLEDAKKSFATEIDRRTHELVIRSLRSRYTSLEYPLTIQDLEKIEEMNIKYHEIKRSLNKKDWTDVKKRFVANFVFESNALEGNSLTLKNFSEIVFENRVSASTDLREVYDAINSYAVFSSLFNGRKALTEDTLLLLHKKTMKNIDDRFGYKKVPNVILGSLIKLTPPEQVEAEVKKLLLWYNEKRKSMHPIELAFKFHHRFEQIHPFADGNGRVGRMLLNYILIRRGYFPVIIRKSHRNRYLKSLEAADHGHYAPLMRFALEKAKDTHLKFFDVYFRYT